MLTKKLLLIRSCKPILEQLFTQDLNTYISLFFYEDEVKLRPNQARVLEKAGILNRTKNGWYANVMIFPFRGKFIVTDFLLSIRRMSKGRYLRDIDDVWVMFPHETLLFIDRLKENGSTACDIASGSGAISLFLAKKFKRVFSLDINPKAVSYARFNVILNRLENKIINLRSDLFGAVKNKRFDFICWNGPTVAMPEVNNPSEVYPLYTYGGYDGAQFTKRFLTQVFKRTKEKFRIKWWDGSLGTKNESVVVKFIKEKFGDRSIKVTVEYLNKKGGVYLHEYDRMYRKYCVDRFELNQKFRDRTRAVKNWYSRLEKEGLSKVYISIITIEPSSKFKLIKKYPTKTYVGPRHVFGFEWHSCSRKFIRDYLLENSYKRRQPQFKPRGLS